MKRIAAALFCLWCCAASAGQYVIPPEKRAEADPIIADIQAMKPNELSRFADVVATCSYRSLTGNDEACLLAEGRYNVEFDAGPALRRALNEYDQLRPRVVYAEQMALAKHGERDVEKTERLDWLMRIFITGVRASFRAGRAAQ